MSYHNYHIKLVIILTRMTEYGDHSRMKNYSNDRSDMYEFTGDVRLQGSRTTIFIGSPIDNNIPHEIKPYARKYDRSSLVAISSIQIKAAPPEKLPVCRKTLDVPGILFSTGGYTHNYFHSITDVMVPLFATSQRFNRNVIFLVTNHNASRFTTEHRKTLESLSRHEVVDIDIENRTLCFTNMIVGLKAHPFDLSIDPSPFSSLSTRNLTRLLRSIYSLKRDSVGDHNRPRLLVVSRKRKRRLANEVQLVELARELGFDYVLQDLGDHLESAAKIVNSIDVLVGVHGAGLTNMVFLPENAIVIQIIPLGMTDNARGMFGANPEEMKLKYLDYIITPNESSLLGKFPNNSLIYTNSTQYCENIGPQDCYNIFYQLQDVKLDLARFKDTLLKALDIMAA
ncbi:alpha-1,3-arabinosyltransferase XAT3-like [Salvia hispanica]|uniref:alpha-1,3-arabinosyltransferase XAT3-like n=1 Tax=Salvia hispanica TaxID=49212 RepID=UPI002009BC2D|nr:alpha-1,3-arabinosyltransferase XAT3-like [Salvia hispanica]